LEIGAAVLLLLWAWEVSVGGEYKVVWNPLLWPLLGLWGVAALQLAAGITVYPFQTRIELLKYTALLALFFLCAQSYRKLEHWHGFVWFLLILGFAVSVFAILQHFTSMENCIGCARFNSAGFLSDRTSIETTLRAWWNC